MGLALPRLWLQPPAWSLWPPVGSLAPCCVQLPIDHKVRGRGGELSRGSLVLEQEPSCSHASRCGVAVGSAEPVSTVGDSQDPRVDAALGCPWLGRSWDAAPCQEITHRRDQTRSGELSRWEHWGRRCPLKWLVPDPHPGPAPSQPPSPPGCSQCLQAGPAHPPRPSPALLHPPQQRWGWESGWWREPAPRLEGSTARNSTCGSAARPGHVPAPHPPQPGHFVTSDVSDGPGENHQTRSVSYPTSSKRV